MNDSAKILVVDDVEMNLEMLECMLMFQGTILKAFNGRQALEILEQNPDTDIILLDLEMPVMDGFETLLALKQDDRFMDIPVIVITASRSEVHRTLASGANDFLAKPYDTEELLLRVKNHIHSKKLTDLTRDMNRILEAEVTKKTAELHNALELSREAEYEIILRLGKAADFRDEDTGMHTKRISEFSKLLATLAGLPEQECLTLHRAAALHDVGKIGIKDQILLKPGGLDNTEFKAMKLHTVIGGLILADAKRFPVLEAGRIIALQHHEKWDGSGYPANLKGDDIHILSRIVTIVDVYDALRSVRPYKEALSLVETLDIMSPERGKTFDPVLYDIFVHHVDEFVILEKKLCGLPGDVEVVPVGSGAL
jgi:putative two-component system response regulator